MRRSGVSVVLAVVLAAALFSCTELVTAPPPATAPSSTPEVRHLQVVAHQDDDILFMNPDVSTAIKVGQPVTTVYLTAGEANVADTAGYAAKRQAGTRAAYAHMAGVRDEWRAEPLVVDHDHRVELYTLKPLPSVQLVFVNLPENADTKALGGPRALVRLWQDRANFVHVRALKPTGGIDGVNCLYDRQSVIDTLVGLYAHFRPTVLRLQDTAPDRRYTGNWVPFHDHPDHVMAALFAREAADLHQRSGTGPRFVSMHYRDYNVDEAPINITPEEQREKLDTFSAYVPHDDQVSMGGPYDAWARRTYYRWPRGVNWVGTDATGRRSAFAVLAGRLVRWSETDSAWTGPVTTADPGGPLAPTISVAGQQVFARRQDTNDVLVLSESGWRNLGNPNRGGAREFEGGAPVAAVVNGELSVFVRNGGGGVSMLTAPDGRTWPTRWADLGGSDVQDGIAVAANGTGWDLFAPTRQTVLRWSRRGGEAPRPDRAFRAPAPSGPLAATTTDGDQTALAYRVADSAAVAVIRPGSAPVLLPAPGGLGAPGLAWTGGQLSIFVRDRAAGVSVSTGGPWTPLPGRIADSPAVSLRDNKITLFALGEDGRLMTTHQPSPAHPFSPWTPLAT
ncbi:PIG-L family deacetylase [Allokutzneria sp. A3M-2-11 16]|uniref:PIG-L family deacetylase n=1 Tax=Allokutzneria sp. A3M-2-11 16 TaxID=2962043 RepID=UPI0020B8513F|nr:PIG-L family deacetylase [Allokutzneria sp. A3M-2-11 16]MCP3799679.1 PIG-L family deacetylase [Allokutzneria sp. A3M-2-11 16]